MISDFQAVRENLFPASHGAIEDWETFPWHRDRTNRIQAYKVHSSQAIAIDVFGTLKTSTDRDRIFDAIAERVGVAPGGPWAITLEWTDTDRLLGEPGRRKSMHLLSAPRQHSSSSASSPNPEDNVAKPRCQALARANATEATSIRSTRATACAHSVLLQARAFVTGNISQRSSRSIRVLTIRPALLREMPISGCATPCWRQRSASTAIFKELLSQSLPITPVSRRRGRRSGV